jgi:hypothetical protein
MHRGSGLVPLGVPRVSGILGRPAERLQFVVAIREIPAVATSLTLSPNI